MPIECVLVVHWDLISKRNLRLAVVRKPSFQLGLMPFVVDCDDVSAMWTPSVPEEATHQLCSTSLKLRQLQWTQGKVIGQWPD